MQALNISRTDSAAINANAASLRAKLEKLTASQRRMQRVNSYVRNRNVRGLKEMNYTEAEIAKLLSGAKPHLGGGFFPTYKLDNAAAQIRSVRAELEAVELATGEHPDQVEGESYTYTADALAVSFQFLAKPDKGTRAILRRAGFVRATGDFHYVREWSSAALRAAAAVRHSLDA